MLIYKLRFVKKTSMVGLQKNTKRYNLRKILLLNDAIIPYMLILPILIISEGKGREGREGKGRKGRGGKGKGSKLHYSRTKCLGQILGR